MELVIEMPEELYEDIKYNFDKQNYDECGGYLISSKIVFGTPLPKGHGRLIDADELCQGLMKRWSTANERLEALISEVMSDVVTPIVVITPTIIEADKENE